MNDNIDKYKSCAKICKNVYLKLKSMILDKAYVDVLQLCNIGNDLLIEECNKVYKKLLKKGILYPVSINLNNCVSGYIYENNNQQYNIIKEDDVVKIDLGVYIEDAVVLFGDTFINNKNKTDDNEYLNLLKTLEQDLTKIMRVGNVNDDVNMYIMSKCSEINCIPIENCTSYQTMNGKIIDEDSKLIILNYQKYYDENDCLLLTNDCFEFENEEIYNINLTIVKGERSKWKTKHEPHIYRFNDYFHNLRLKSSREFLAKCKNINKTNAFSINNWKLNPKWRIGIKECVDYGILEDYPVMYENDLVFTKKFTVMVTNNGCMIFN